MATSQLQIYNEALVILGERQLGNLAENREPRRVLDAIWNEGTITRCLEQGQWNFAIRTVKLSYDPLITPDAGYQYAVQHPDDYVRLVGISLDERFNTPLNAYSDEGSYWYNDNQEIYVRYVSSDADFGANFDLWPGTFVNYVAYYMAEKAVRRLTQNQTDREVLKRDARKALVDARSKDALGDPTKFLPTGSWVRTRVGGVYRDGGNRNSLIG